MKRTWSVWLLMVIFLLAQAPVAQAKGGTSSGARSSAKSSFSSSSSSKSSSSSSSSKSSGYSGSSSSSSKSSTSGSTSSGSSSSSKSSTGGTTSGSSSSGTTSKSSDTGSSASSGSGYSGSSSASSRNAPSSYGGASSSGASSSGSTAAAASSSKSTSSKTTSARSSYISDSYKKQASSYNYDSYKKTLNADQQKAYTASTSRTYSGSRLNYDDALRTRPQRITVWNVRPVMVGYNPLYFSSPFSYGYAFIGPWDMWFLMRASDLFWYHHWNDILPYRDRFEDAKFREMEARIARLEAQNNGVRDANYLEPGVDPDLQYSGDYQSSHLDDMYYTNKYAKPPVNPVATVVVVVLIGAGLIILIRAFATRPRRPKGSTPGLY